MNSKIVIVGAGYSGILTAKKLAKKFKKDDDVTITIIDKNPYHVMLTEIHEVAAGRVDEESIRASLKKIFAKRKVNVVLDTITSFDFDAKEAIGKESTYKYDYLVISAGSKPTFFGIDGAKENVFQLWSYDDALKIKAQIQDMFVKASRTKNNELRKKLLTFFVVGAGFTGVEMAGELAEYVPIIAKKYEIDPNEVTVNIVDMLDRTIPQMPKKLSDKAEKRLKKMGVNVILGSNVCEVGKDYINIIQNDECITHETNTVIWSCGVESADITEKASDNLPSKGRNRIVTDAYLRSIEREDVYIIGDNMFYIPEGEEHPVPQVVENCENSADTAAVNIERSIRKNAELEEYKPGYHGYMVCIGGRYGVARVGLANKKINLPSFLAMFVKHFINIIYFFQILGWNKTFSYLKHEIFTIRNDRSFVGGHFSNKTPSFLLVPLRIWLGIVWIFEGWKKINEGWFKNPKLTEFFESANVWFDSLTGTVSADAASSATAEVTGEAFINWNIIGLFRIIFVSGKTFAESTLSDFALKIDIPLMNWFVDNVILSGDTIQLIMQAFIIIAEILIGLALMGGLLTFPAAGFSLILQFMFVTTTGLYLSTFWMVFAAIAVLIGGGRIFGFDYYVMPWLKEKWSKTSIARKLYIYND